MATQTETDSQSSIFYMFIMDKYDGHTIRKYPHKTVGGKGLVAKITEKKRKK